MNQSYVILYVRFKTIVFKTSWISLIISFFTIINFTANAQSMGISSISITPDPSSILELRTTSKGLLTPRMTTLQRDAISTPATGLVIYNTTTNQFNFYNGTIWSSLASGNGVSSVSGTTNRISIGGTSTDPTIDISSNYVGQSSITTLGTIATGTWNGTSIAIANGGTGQTTKTAAMDALSPMTTLGDIVYGGAAGTNTRLAGNITTAKQFLTQTGNGTVSAAPIWGTIANTDISGLGTLSTLNSVDLSGIQATGTLAAARFGALTGDITNTAGSYATTIANNAVTLAKFQQISTNTLLGRSTASTGNAEVITVGSGLSLSGGTLSATNTNSGTVTSVSVVSANGLAGTVANATTTPAITLSTSVSGMLKGNGTAISAATSGTDYSAGTSALATGIIKSTTTTGALSIAVAGDFPTLNQNTTGNAATVTTNANLTGDVTSVGNATTLATINSNVGTWNTVTVNGKGLVTAGSNTTYVTAESDPVVKAINGIVKSNGTTISAATVRTDYAEPTTALATGLLKNTTTTGAHSIATAGTDYSAGTSALATGIIKSTTTTGALSIAVVGDFPTLNQNTTGNAATVTTNANLTGDVTSVGNATTLATVNSNVGTWNTVTVNGKGLITAGSNTTYVTSETDPIVKAVNGLVKSNGTTITAAVAGTDYVTANSTNTFTNKSGNISQWTNDANYITNTNVVLNNQANSYTAGAKQTFAADATNAGLRLIGVTSDPSTLVAGDIWYRSDLEKIQYRGAASTRYLVAEALAQTLTNKDLTSATNTFPTLNQNTTGTASNVTGTVAIANGGTGQTTASAAFNALSPVTTLGDIIYGSAANTNSRLAGNTTATKNFLTQTGNGSVSAAPAWGAIAVADVPTLNQSTTGTASGSYVGTQTLTSGTTYTSSAGVTKIIIRMIGGGGAGGGVSGAASQAAAAAGGGAGAYLEKAVTVTASTAYTIAIGAGGAAGTPGPNVGGNGGSTTIAIGATTYTAPGGTGGAAMTTGTTLIFSTGGAGGAISTNGDVNTGGHPGTSGIRMSATASMSGQGAPSQFGAGGIGINSTSTAGNAGIGYGSGGSGAASISNGNQAGGAGKAGIIIINEYK